MVTFVLAVFASDFARHSIQTIKLYDRILFLLFTPDFRIDYAFFPVCVRSDRKKGSARGPYCALRRSLRRVLMEPFLSLALTSIGYGPAGVGLFCRRSTRLGLFTTVTLCRTVLLTFTERDAFVDGGCWR